MPEADNQLVSHWAANKRSRGFAVEKLPKTFPNLMSGDSCYNVRERLDWNCRNGFRQNSSLFVTTN